MRRTRFAAVAALALALASTAAASPGQKAGSAASRDVNVTLVRFLVDVVERRDVKEGFSLVSEPLLHHMTAKEWQARLPVPAYRGLAIAKVRVLEQQVNDRQTLAVIELDGTQGKETYLVELRQGDGDTWTVGTWLRSAQSRLTPAADRTPPRSSGRQPSG